MASSWRYGKRCKYRTKETEPEFLKVIRNRYGFLLIDKVSQDSDDYYRLDTKKSAAENCYDIYTGLCCRDTRDTKRLFLLNGLATLCQQQQQELQNKKQSVSSRVSTVGIVMASRYNLGFSTEELLYCLSASLIHTFTQVRAAALRTIRYVLATIADVEVFNSMQLPYLLCRSIDLKLKNDDERVQALKLIRKMLAISAEIISPVLVRCLVSLADTDIEEDKVLRDNDKMLRESEKMLKESDNMLKACLATLCEFAVLNPTLLICCGGVTSITRNVLECHNPRIAESLSGVLLYLLEWPQTRKISGVRLDCLAAPYCDFTYRLGIMDKNKDARELRYTSCRLALLSVLRSWTGTIEFCDPSKPSGLKAIVDALYLNQIEIRKAILELLYELLGLPQPTWTEEYIVALQAVDPSDFQDNWLLSNGFVAAEGRSILPTLAARTPNICEQHLALQLYCFLETGVLNALVEVIVSTEISVSIAATVLIGKILHLMHTHLPADICSTSAALPSLLAHATQGNQHASAAISALQCYQKMLRNRPASSSLFLDSIIQGGSLIHTRLFRREINALPFSTGNLQSSPAAEANIGGTQSQSQSQSQPLSGTLERTRLDSVSSSDESNSQSSSTRRSSFRLKCKFLPFLENIKVNRLIKDSNVLNTKDGSGWDWEIISTIIRCNLIRRAEEPSLQFLKNLIGYFKPTNNNFSHQELVHGKSLPVYVKVGLDLIDWLLAFSPFESVRLLTDFFDDVATQLLAVTKSNRAHDCLFSPQHMNNTMCQQYFIFIGRMCRSQKGINILKNTDVFENLNNLVLNTIHVCYVKLIVSGLDYTLDSKDTRTVLKNALTSAKTRSGRLYSTQFLVVLLRSRITTFEVWGIPLIIQQTKDPDRSIVLAAMDVLEEACHERYYLEEIVRLWPNLKPLGDIGRIVMARYYSLPRGLNSVRAQIEEEIEYWKNGYNKRYVLLVEADTHSSLTLHIRNEDGYYSRRNCNTRPIIIPPNIPAHLYGQMVQTEQGTTALSTFGDLPQLISIVCSGKCSDETECLELKSALWAIAHASTHTNGIEYFKDQKSSIYDKFVFLATKCEVYSIRATSFNCLGLIGSTKAGANLLFDLKWLSVRHDRNTTWPVHQPEDWISVRHHYENMPLHNYTELDNQNYSSYWNLPLSSTSTSTYRDAVGAASASSEAQDANTTTDSIKTSGEEVSGDNSSQPTNLDSPRTQLEKLYYSKQVGVSGTSVSGSASGSGNVLGTSNKSKTLPEGSYLRYSKHQRSLSESKTTDVISLISAVTGGVAPISGASFYHSHRTRYNSCTDSNTSGVSSCESVTGRAAAMGEIQQFPLSPIPSLSNLSEIPLRRSYLRRTSLAGTSNLQNAASPLDIKGYAQLRSLRRHCRPVLSESAAELYDIVDRMELLSFASFRPRKSSFGDSQRKMKVRSLDRQTSLRMYAHLDSEELQVPLPTLTVPKFLSQNDSKGPCYMGISLPKNLLDMFPARNFSRTYVSQVIQEQDLMDINLLTTKQQFLNDSLNNEGGDESSVISSLSDVSSVSKRSKWIGAKHGRNNCLHCCRLRKQQRFQNQTHLDSGPVDFSSTSTLCEMYTNSTLSRKGVSVGTGGLTNKLLLHQTQQALQQQQQQFNTSTIHLSELQFHSPESILSEESIPDKLTANILYNVQRLANPVSAKQSKLALLELKNKHTNSFKDICLYSEVCRTLGRNCYRIKSRRFLQELFQDVDFDSFYNEPLEIISKKEKDSFKSIEIKDKVCGADNLSLLKERMKRDSPCNRLDINASSSKIESNQAVVTTSNNVIIGPQTLKTHIKSQLLASVCEASCENLNLDSSPPLPNPSISEKPLTIKQNCKSFTIAPPPAAPPPLHEYNTELRITSDDDDDDDDVHNNNINEEEHSGNICYRRSPQRQKRTNCDEIDFSRVRSSSSANSLHPASASNTAQSIHLATTTVTSHPTYLQSGGGSISTPISSSNCSDQTTASNPSSVCTITHHPLNTNNNTRLNSTPLTSPTLPNSIENENTKFRRGRFYTLELDLSCTKNKFPITDRTKTTSNSLADACKTTTTDKLPASPSSFSIISPTKALTKSVTLLRQHSLGSESSSNYKLPISRLSYTAGTIPISTSLTTTTSTNLTDTAVSSTDGDNQKYLITKSLASSLAQPFGTLYCEKRLKSSKSEAVLVQNPLFTTNNSSSLSTAINKEK